MKNKKNLIIGFFVILIISIFSCCVIFKSNEKIINITAKKFDFTPNNIVVNQGEKVILKVSTIDRVHGFFIPELGVNEQIIPGKVIEVKLNTEKKGKFFFMCNIFCGSGHEEMNGYIEIK